MSPSPGLTLGVSEQPSILHEMPLARMGGRARSGSAAMHAIAKEEPNVLSRVRPV